MKVCHTCDNPPCVNPWHLFLGENKDNSRDMVRKGRQAKGEKNGGCKHLEATIKQLKKDREGGASYSQLVRKFGISKTQVARIVKGESW
jgi:DNA invertase Pin-like site-specific DNA recombinase